jgi:uncharacterized protein YlxP (DUF503 family)
LPVPSRSEKGYVGILSAELHFPESGSLKSKRMHLRRVRDQVTRRFGATFAEVGHQDLWQRSRVVIAVAASDLQVLEGTLDKVRTYLDSQEWVLTFCSTEVVDVDA